MDMVLAKSDLAIAERYSELADPKLREAIFPRLAAEYRMSRQYLLEILGAKELLTSDPLLARSISNRFPYIDPLNHVQIELLKRLRAGEKDERIVQGVHLTINGIAAGLPQQRLMSAVSSSPVCGGGAAKRQRGLPEALQRPPPSPAVTRPP